jgi:phosphosulfolactate phosphohydrolase-like enzyme
VFVKMRDTRSVSIDSVSEDPVRHSGYDAVVLIDVLCDTTTLVTAAAQHRQVYPVASASAALHLGREMREPLLAASETETWRPGFEIYNSPSALARRTDRRPLVLSCGVAAALAANPAGWPQAYFACFRNMAATARFLTMRHENVLILEGAGDGDVRCEDQIAAARIASLLVEAGFSPVGMNTREALDRWASADANLTVWGRSAEELRRRRREADLEFVLGHIDDVEVVCSYTSPRLHAVHPAELASELSGVAL